MTDVSHYERISDTVMWFSNDVCLKFNVSLAKKDAKGRRRFFYKEWVYDSKYSDTGDVISIKREIRCYLSIDNIRQNNGQGNVMIERGDLPMLRSKVTEAASWVGNPDVFKVVGNDDNKKLQIMSDASCVMNLGNRSALMFEPVILTYENSDLAPGIRMSIGDTRNFIDIPINTFMEFYEFLRTFDMYTAACAVIASIPMSKEDAEMLRGKLGNIGGSSDNNGATRKSTGKNFFTQ